MFLDSTNMFSEGQTLSGTSADSTNTLNLGHVSGAGLWVVARFEKASHGVTGVSIQCDSGSGFVSCGHHAVSDTKAGAGVNIPLPQDLKGKVKLTYQGSSMTGKVTAGITFEPDSPRGARIGDIKRTFD